MSSKTEKFHLAEVLRIRLWWLPVVIAGNGALWVLGVGSGRQFFGVTFGSGMWAWGYLQRKYEKEAGE